MNRVSDPLHNLADALSDDVVAASAETRVAEVAQERDEDAGFALAFDRVVGRAERRARWRRFAQRLRALAPSSTVRSWRPAMAAVAGIAVIVVAGDLYLNVGQNVGLAPPAATPASPPQFHARVPVDDAITASRKLAHQAEQRENDRDVPAPAPPPTPPAAASVDAPKRVQTVPIAPAAEAPMRPPAPPQPAAVTAGGHASGLLNHPAPPASRKRSETHVAAAPAPAVAAVDEAAANRAAVPLFAWPLHGVVIAGNNAFAKTDGRDDGIDIAVPAGTDVRAAADGVVAYVGDDLMKNYGNVILLRHDGGFITAYAHVDQILVKVDDRVQRGQVIAKSGGTGAVSTPLLHFEIRKGSAPVDARQYLQAK